MLNANFLNDRLGEHRRYILKHHHSDPTPVSLHFNQAGHSITQSEIYIFSFILLFTCSSPRRMDQFTSWRCIVNNKGVDFTHVRDCFCTFRVASCPVGATPVRFPGSMPSNLSSWSPTIVAEMAPPPTNKAGHKSLLPARFVSP